MAEWEVWISQQYSAASIAADTEEDAKRQLVEMVRDGLEENMVEAVCLDEDE